MSWAAKRKLLYLFGFLIVAGLLIGIPLYNYLHAPASCFDNKQNQGEEGVDCGGPCVQLCKPLEITPVVSWQQTFKVVSGIYTAVAYIENPNVNAEAFQVPYTFTFYDANNAPIGTKSGVTEIPAGKNFAVLETNISLPKDPARTSFELDPNISWQAARRLPEINVNNQLLTNASTSPVITADVQNSTFTDVGKILVTVVVYDTNGNAFAASRTIIDSLPKQSSQHIIFTWRQPFDRTAAQIEIIPLIQ